jgi:hypothetical protein
MRPNPGLVLASFGLVFLVSRGSGTLLRSNPAELTDVQGLVSAGNDDTAPYSPTNPFLFWTDYPGSPQYDQLKPQWSVDGLRAIVSTALAAVWIICG